ncbi:hypothetical protein JNL27_13640 [bacterium]|nr:hypothetical protein [bacterium]
MLTYDELIYFIINAVDSMSSIQAIEECNRLGMKKIEFQHLSADSNIPQYDNGYAFTCSTQNNNISQVEILEKEKQILQMGFQIVYKPRLILSRITGDLKRMNAILKNYYGDGVPMAMDNVDILNFGNENTACYISKIKINNYNIITLRVGNRLFWN